MKSQSCHLAPIPRTHPSSSNLEPRTSAAALQYPTTLSNHAQNLVTTSAGDVQLITLSTENMIPSKEPSFYGTVSRFTERVTYAFRPLSPTTMILVPPESRPRYHISAGSNCFTPSSYITTIRRGGSEIGELVADFEMGDSTLPQSVYIRGTQHLIKDSIKTPKSAHFGRNIGWKDRQLFYNNYQEWTLSFRNLEWDLSENTKICTSSSSSRPSRKVLYAKFTPCQGRDLAQLEVTPEGQDQFDDILISALILEWKRLMLDSVS